MLRAEPETEILRSLTDFTAPLWFLASFLSLGPSHICVLVYLNETVMGWASPRKGRLFTRTVWDPALDDPRPKV